MPTSLEEWLALAPEEGVVRLAADGDAESTLRGFGDECERLCAANVGQAVRAGERLRAACDALAAQGHRFATRAKPRVLRAVTTALAYAGRLEEALRAADEAMLEAERSSQPVEGARAAVASLHPLTKLGRIEEAIGRGERARVRLDELGEPALAARAHINLGNLRKSIGDLDGARRDLEMARAALMAEPAMVAHLENTLGEIHLLRDDFAAARGAFGLAISHFRDVEQSFAAAIAQGNLADLAAREGRLQESLGHFESARRVLERDDVRGHLARLAAEEAEVLNTLGAPGEALAVLERTLPWLDEGGFVAESLRARLARARVWASIDRLGEARSDAESVRAGAAARGDRFLERRAALLEAELDLWAGDPARAATTASAIVDAPDAPALDRSIAALHLARAIAAMGDRDGARSLLDRAIERCRATAVAGVLADLLFARAGVSDADAAIADLDEAATSIERVRASIQSEGLRSAWTGRRGAVYERLALLRLAQGTPDAVEAAFDAVERSRSRTLLDLVQRAVDREVERPRSDSDDDDRALREEFDRLRRRLAALYSRWEREGTPGERRSAVPLDRVAAEIRVEERTLEDVTRRLAARQGERSLYAVPLSALALRRRLAVDERIVSYFVAEGELLAIVLAPDGVVVRRRLAGGPGLADAAAKLLFRMRRAARDRSAAGPRRAAEDLSALERLHDLLWEPIVDALDDARSVAVVPCGALHGLPFHALRDRRRDCSAIERWEIRTAPSATLALGRAPLASRAGGVLVVGASDDAAPAIAGEVRSVAAFWPGASTLVEGDATVAAVLAAVPNASLIHLACHGRFAESMPNASGLRLADRWLSLGELLETRLAARLVILAGCETGRATLQPGEEAVGLPRALLAAGAATVLVSLWPVDDAAAAEQMVDLHRRLAEEPSRRIGSLVRESMLETMRRRPHPAKWAAFSLVGADPPATIDAADGPRARRELVR